MCTCIYSLTLIAAMLLALLSATINVSMAFGPECPTLPELILVPEALLLHLG